MKISIRTHALHLVRRAIQKGRAAIGGLHAASPAAASLEQAFSNLLSDVTSRHGLRLRIFVQGKPRTLNPAIQEQLFLIGREALMKALSHSEATKIEVEVQYLRDLVRVFVRDRGMHEQGKVIGARFGIWSRTGAGTEVRVAVLIDPAKWTTHDRGRREGRQV